MIKTLQANTIGRDFIVGDLHGCYDLLLASLKHVEFNSATDRLISVGDLVDRGSQNEQCLELLDEDWFHCTLGNHEQMMLAWLTGDYALGQYWDYNGGGWWRNCPYKADESTVASLVAKLKALPLCIKLELPDGELNYVIHADLYTREDTNNYTFDAQFNTIAMTQMGDGEAILWGRNRFGPFYGSDVQTRKDKAIRTVNYSRIPHSIGLGLVYSGHTIVQRPLYVRGQICIDTGAFKAHNTKWAGLTLVEPFEGKFWKTNYEGTREVEPIIL